MITVILSFVLCISAFECHEYAPSIWETNTLDEISMAVAECQYYQDKLIVVHALETNCLIEDDGY